MEALLPQLSGGQVVITTRLRNWSAAVDLQEVDFLSPEAATELLLERTVDRCRQATATPLRPSPWRISDA
ncbi:MAG: hypothetical protein ACKO8I_08340 [Cyanobacteriota bacterium]